MSNARTVRQIAGSAFIPYGTAGMGGVDLPPTSQPVYSTSGNPNGVQQYPGSSGAVVQVPGNNGGSYGYDDYPSPGAGYNPNAGWTGRLGRSATGGLPGLAVGGALELYRRLFHHNTANPSPQQMGGRPGELPGTLQFDSNGQVLNNPNGPTGTIAGIDPRTGRPVMNATPAGNYSGGSGGTGRGEGLGGGNGGWGLGSSNNPGGFGNFGFAAGGGGNISHMLMALRPH